MKIDSDEEIKKAILTSLSFVAPEVDVTTLRHDLPLREQVDIDSLDFVRFIVHLHKTLGVDIPEVDYSHLATIDSSIRYIKSKTGSPLSPHTGAR